MTDLIVDPSRRCVTLTFVRGALVSLLIALSAGALAVLFYVPSVAPHLQRLGLEFPVFRPIHTTFTSAWIFLGGIALVHHFLQGTAGKLGPAEKTLVKAQVVLWAFAGAAILVTLLLGISSGREYMDFHPSLSIPILLGWICFAINFYRAAWRGFMQQPIYVSMWGIAIVFFTYTFIEQHAWLIPGVFADPVVDTRIQWKSCGTLVGSFNLFVYAALYYVGEQVTGDKHYARSRLAYALFSVGLVNSFTNFAHHTYHVPQTQAVKWISFVISMAEIILFYRVAVDLSRAVAKKRHGERRAWGRFDVTTFYLGAAKWWTCVILGTSIVLSIPPLNSLVHGTHVITAHAMGAEFGIDTMALFAAISWLLGRRLARHGLDPALLSGRAHYIAAVGGNIAAVALVGWLHVSGTIVGYGRYLDQPPPAWLVRWNPPLFALSGIALAGFLTFTLLFWARLAFARESPSGATERAPSGAAGGTSHAPQGGK